MPLTLLAYWKEILVGVLVIGLICLGIWFRGVIADRDELRSQIKQATAQIENLAKLNQSLTEAVKTKETELQRYINLSLKLMEDKTDIQRKYDSYMGRIQNETIEVKPGIGITKPITIIGPGVPTFSNYSSGTYRPSVPGKGL